MKSERAAGFLRDLRRQYSWYLRHADADTAQRFSNAVHETCNAISTTPEIGPKFLTTVRRLQKLRFYVITRPFNRFLIFYELSETETLIFRRVVDGSRDLIRTL